MSPHTFQIDAPAKSPTTRSRGIILYRKPSLLDALEYHKLTARTYQIPLSASIGPYCFEHPNHWNRGSIQRFTSRLFNPRGAAIVACTVANPSVPIGFAQSIRRGSDADAKHQIGSVYRIMRIAMWLGGCRETWRVVREGYGDFLLGKLPRKVREGRDQRRISWTRG